MSEQRQKNILAIHDISGVGRCSLTVALPIISSCGITVSALPTAILSTHTGEIPDYVSVDFTDKMEAFAEHWKKLGVKFDAIYTGYLGSLKQIDIVCKIIDEFKEPDTLVVVDPVMADNGVMYANFDKKFAKSMHNLCEKADYIVPNLTEAAFLLDKEYLSGPYTEEYIKEILNGLSALSKKGAVLTGVYFDNETLGAAYTEKNTNTVGYSMGPKYDGMFYGTGDVFASCFLAMLTNGKTIRESVETATYFTNKSIESTVNLKTDRRMGVAFEYHLNLLN